MKIQNFVPSTQTGTDRNGYITTLQTCLNYAYNHNIKNLIIDVTSNPCAFILLSSL